MSNEQGLWRAVYGGKPKVGTTREEVAGELRAAHQRAVRQLQDSRDKMNPRSIERMKRWALVLLVDAYEVEKHGLTSVGEYLR